MTPQPALRTHHTVVPFPYANSVQLRFAVIVSVPPCRMLYASAVTNAKA